MYIGSNFLTQTDPIQYPTDATQPDPSGGFCKDIILYLNGGD